MQLFAQLPDDRVVVLDVSPSDTVGEIARRLSLSEPSARGACRLVKGGLTLPAAAGHALAPARRERIGHMAAEAAPGARVDPAGLREISSAARVVHPRERCSIATRPADGILRLETALRVACLGIILRWRF